MSLHVYFNEVEWVIAESEDEASKIWFEFTGESPEDYPDDELVWDRWDDDRELSIYDETLDKPTTLVKTCKEWIELKGRGFLCSTEY